MRPIDLCLANGDMIDGRGEKSGSTELITSDRIEQCGLASEILKYIDAKEYIFTYGTGYHASGSGEDFEDIIAKDFKAKIGGQQFFSVNGLIFHAKHKISGSSIPHGRFTALARQKMWNLFWSEYGQTPRAHVFIRSHCHYYDFCGGRGWLAMITPGLQGWGSKFGERICEGTVDFGFVHFDIIDKEQWGWQAHISGVDSTSVHQF